MNPYNWQSYQYSLEQWIRNQSHKIKALEERLDYLEGQLQTMQEQKSTSVEKIEYHFDQLKIETLEGTLNIGLSPQGIDSADELSIPNPLVKNAPANPNPFTQQLQGELQPFLRNELPTKLKEFAEKHKKSFPPGFENMIYQDIYRQLPARIEHYIRLHSENNNGVLNENTKQTVMEDIKKEITHSIQSFFENKGGS
ncbi:spore germination protein GerPC [Salirhabdus sp. Marseille-P4669]|uniref:spore germination protein GerPC n=1 Tax=Salirhabdus sp. Marseille-P4669 TaxID=2042310 RepID=UPI0013573FCB|nr:spore germination protein GerPC [Salirhabdus sp. Marseille-P4669]